MLSSCMPGIAHCRPTGRRHERSDVMCMSVPYVVQAARIAPRYQSVLYTVVTRPLCRGWEISVMSKGHVALEILLPIPMRNRPARNMGSGLDRAGSAWMMEPRITRRHPMAVPWRRPR